MSSLPVRLRGSANPGVVWAAQPSPDRASSCPIKEMSGRECPHSMSGHLTPQPFSEDEPKPSPGMPKTADYSVRLSRDVRSGTARSLLGASVRRRQPDPSHGDGGAAAQHLDVGDQHGRVPGARADPVPFPHRFEELPPAIFLEHYVEERTPEGQLGRKATWDRLSFHSWAPRRVWHSGPGTALVW
jgi:hypothetical protein